jgi:type I restriction enzyme S subunit
MESKTRLGYKPTEIGRIPKEWEVVRLGDVINVLPGFAFSSRHFNKDKGVPLIRIRDLGKNSTEAFYSGPFDDEYIVNPNEILVGMDGEFNAYLWKGSKSLLNQRVCKIWPKDGSKMDRLYLYYVVHRPLDIIEYRVGQTTVKHLSTNHFDTVFIPFPPLPEQRRIASILSTVDEAIQRVDEAIARTERLKRGLMQRLLTRGIGHKEFKDTEIGRIPKGWAAVRLKEITLPTENIDPRSETEREFKYVDITSIENLAIIDWSLINSNNAPSRARQLIKAKDVIFATTRPYLKNVAIVPEELDDQICSTGFCVIRPNEEFTISEWIFYNILTERFIHKISSKMKGATYPAVSDKDVLSEKIPRPPLPEQQKITEILSTVDKKLELERKRMEKLERIKKGLMNDLLTGKVRVR